MYFINRISSKIVPKTPYELWVGRKPILRHLYVLDCQAEVRVYNPHENKLDTRTISGISFCIVKKIKRI